MYSPEYIQAKGGGSSVWVASPITKVKARATVAGRATKRAVTGGRVSTTTVFTLQVAEVELNPFVKRGAFICSGAGCMMCGEGELKAKQKRDRMHPMYAVLSARGSDG